MRLLPFNIIIAIVALAALVLPAVGHAQTLDPVLVSNTGQTAGSDLATATGRASYAQSFTTSDHPDGYFLSSVEVGLKAGNGVTAEVALWWSHRTTTTPGTGFYSFPQHILTTLSGVPDIDDDASTLERFSANDVLLLPNTTYWIVVTRTGGADDGLSVATTSSGDAVDAGGMAGFSVGNNVWVPDLDSEDEWADYSGSVDASMKIGLRGSEATRPPGPYATNRNEQSRAAAAETSSSTSGYATSFTTSRAANTHQLTSVLLSVAAESGVSPRVAIHADKRGSPAPSAVTNGTLAAPANVSRVLGAPDRAEFTASTAISLAESTRYWVVLDVGSGSGRLSVSTTADDDEDGTPGVRWDLGNTMQAYNGSSWSNDSHGPSFWMALNGPTDPNAGSFFSVFPRFSIGLPQVGVGVAAEIQDFRVKNASWQWQRGETRDGPFTDIPAAQGGTWRVYEPAAADLGKWLKALVSYENAFGPGKSASGVSDNAVLSQPVISNAGQIADLGYALEQLGKVNFAQAFTTGGDPSGYLLSGLRFGIDIDTGANTLSWALYADAAGEPAAAPLFTHLAVPSDSLDSDKYTFEDLVHPGFVLAPDTKYWAVLTTSPLIEGTETGLLLTAISEWGSNVIWDGPAAELDPGSESDWTLDFSPLSSPTDTMSPEEWVPFVVALELPGKMVLRMSVLTYPEVTASFGQASYSVAEGATQSVTVTLSADPERTVTIPITTSNRAGASNTDYSVPENVTFNSGETSKTFTFSATQDTEDDDDESVKLGFGTLPPEVSAGTPSETTFNITDDDDPQVSVSFGAASYSVAEGSTVTVRVTLSADPERSVTIPITTMNEGGAANGDYSGVPANVVFASGETEQTFAFRATQDTGDDDDESVKLGFGNLPTRVSAGTPSETTFNITDDDDPQVSVSFGATSYSVAEGGTVTVRVTLSADPERRVTIPITTMNEGGAANGDYSGVPANVVFASGETAKTFAFRATQDTGDDDDESVRLGFGPLPTGVSEGATRETVVSITDDDVPSVTVSFAQSAYSVGEGNTVTVRVTLSADPERSVTIPITTMNEGGAANGDYSGVPANVVFASGETEQTFAFRATQDTGDDDDESVKLGFGNLPTRVSAGTPSETTVNITDDDDPQVSVSFGATSYSVAEGSTVTVRVTLSADPERSVTIPITTVNEGGASNGDYSGVPANVVFASGETAKTFAFRATQDNGDDDDESVKLGFGNLPTGVSEGATRETVVSITDDDVPSVTVSFAQSAYSVGEGNTVTVRVTLSADPERSVTIPITTMNEGGAANGDYSGVPANVVFASGETEQTFAFRATQDTGDDDDESVKLGFGNLPTRVSAGTPSETTVNITDDDDPQVSVSFGATSYSVAEGGTVTVRVTLSADPERSVTIPITTVNEGGATSADYSGVPANVVFASGETAKTFAFRATQDTGDDDDESVKLGFGNLPTGVSEGATRETVVSITDDDVPSVTVSFGQSSYSVAEGNTVAVRVTLSADPERTVSIPLTTMNEGGASNSDYSGVPASVVFASGETAKTFTLRATQDEVDDDGESVIVSFEAPLPDGVSEGAPHQSTVSITDDDDAAIVLSEANLIVKEGDATGVSYSVKLASQPTANVTVTISGHSGTDLILSGTTLNASRQLTFTTANWNTAQTVTIQADQDEDAGDDENTLTHTASGGGYVNVTADLPVTITDDETASIVLVPASLVVEEGDATGSSYTVKLSHVPTGMVMVTISGHSGTDLSLSGTTLTSDQLTFTAANWNTVQTVTVRADQDDDPFNDVATLLHAASGGSYDSATETLGVTVSDDETASIVLSPDSLTVEEGDATGSSYTVTLSHLPMGTVTVTISGHSGTDLSLSGTTLTSDELTFTAANWNTAQTVTVRAADDSDDADGSETLTHTATGGGYGSATADLPVTITDDAPATVAVSFGSATYSVIEGSSVTVEVNLDADPERSVTVPITATKHGSSNSDYSGVPKSVTFNSGDTSTTFTVFAVEDSLNETREQVQLGFGSQLGVVSRGSPSETTVSMYDRTQGQNLPTPPTVHFGSATYNVAEGGSVAVSVKLSKAPGSDVEIPITTTNRGATGADYSGVPASLTFGAADTEQTIVLLATDDAVDDDAESVTLGFGTLPGAITATTGEADAAIVSITDDDVPSVTVSFGQSAYSVAEGNTVTVRVTLSADPERSVTIPITTVERGRRQQQRLLGRALECGVRVGARRRRRSRSAPPRTTPTTTARACSWASGTCPPASAMAPPRRRWSRSPTTTCRR